MWTCYDCDAETGVDVAYILLADAHPGEDAIKIVKVEPQWQKDLPDSIQKTVKSIMLEFDNEGRLIAIEIWGASSGLPRVFLEAAARQAQPKPMVPK